MMYIPTVKTCNFFREQVINYARNHSENHNCVGSEWIADKISFGKTAVTVEFHHVDKLYTDYAHITYKELSELMNK